VLRMSPPVLNDTAAHCGPPFGTKRPQVQILSPRPCFRRSSLKEWAKRSTRKGSPQPALRFEGRHRAGVRIDLQRHRQVCVAQDPHDRPRVDFQIHHQRCPSPPRVVNRHLADTRLVTSSGRCRLRARGPRASHTCRRTPGVDPRQPRQTSPASALSLSWSGLLDAAPAPSQPCRQRSDCWAVLGSSARRSQRRWPRRSRCWARNASARPRVEHHATDP
jgi:hypothetical protein